MQNFAINGGTLNGDPEVWIDDSSASVVFQAAGDGMRGAMGAGTAQCSIVSSGALALQAKLEGGASVTWAASGSITYGVSLVGSAPFQVNASLQGVRWAMLEGQAPTEFYADGDVQVVPAISATFVMTLASDLDLHVATGHHGEGITPIVFQSSFDAIVAKGARLEGYAPIVTAGIGYPALTITSPAGEGSIQFTSAGDARIGSKIGLEGVADLSLFAVADLGVLHYVYAEGSASIHVAVKAETHGVPSIPSDYFPAPSGRYFYVMGERRHFIVPKDREVLGSSGYIPLVDAVNALHIYANYELPSDMVAN